ncbi:MAG: hypothetical protein OXL37_04365 [Chloroflexota bacterium]|nr:hypothetical protein [Chloroflexota bacterium]MDE2960944.1 hypothetical protein [Chloroflexota bacterium]
MTTEATQTVADLTIAELVALLRETVTASLAEIVGCASDQQEPCQGAVPETEPGGGADDSELVHPPDDSHLTAATDGTGVSPKMAQKVSDLPVADFQWWIHYIVGEVGEDLIGDPDEGLEFTEEFLAGLDQSIAEAAAGKTIPAEEVFRRLGLD